MSNKKESKKELLASCFKELLTRQPFHKISVKMITDRAGMSRSSFYKFFADKYELLIFIADYQVIRKVEILLEAGMFDAGVELLFRSIVGDADFFRQAFAVEGQNSFEKGFGELLERCIRRQLAAAQIALPLPSLLTLDNLARYYALALCQAIRAWLNSERRENVEELLEAYFFLHTHSLDELVRPQK